MHSFQPVAVAVLTGFLGSGKTTLLNRLLKAPGMEGTAVIVNEFGEVGIDHLLVEQAVDGLIELSDGCLCCTVRGELVDTLADLIERMQTGRIAPLRRIVIETTGLADPAPILHTLMGDPGVLRHYRLDGIVTVVDAVNGSATLDAQPESVKQVAVADRLVLSKSDLAEPEAVDRHRRTGLEVARRHEGRDHGEDRGHREQDQQGVGTARGGRGGRGEHADVTPRAPADGQRGAGATRTA